MQRRYHKKTTADLLAKLLPMPVAPILLCGPLATATGPAYRSALTLALAYWCSVCRPLPSDDSTRAHLCRVPPQHYATFRAELDIILETLFPALLAEFEARRQSQERKHAQALYALKCRNEKRRQAKQLSANDLPATIERPRIQPTKAQRHSNGRVDLAARSAATERERNAKATAQAGKLSDTVPSRLGTRSPG
jgi:hypothetical protein